LLLAAAAAAAAAGLVVLGLFAQPADGFRATAFYVGGANRRTKTTTLPEHAAGRWKAASISMSKSSRGTASLGHRQQKQQQKQQLMELRMSSEVNDDNNRRQRPQSLTPRRQSAAGEADESPPPSTNAAPGASSPPPLSPLRSAFEALRRDVNSPKKMPPIQVDDFNLLYYDIFLILNLVVSVSFWVVHRMHYEYIGSALNEGCLLSLLWIGSGLYTGAFLDSALDGHYGSSDERGGPKGAGLLAFQTFINAINLRLVVALLMAVAQHRPVGESLGEQLMPLEIGFGLVLMSVWRAVYSSFVPRI
jgi:hypothetical protein